MSYRPYSSQAAEQQLVCWEGREEKGRGEGGGEGGGGEGGEGEGRGI